MVMDIKGWILAGDPELTRPVGWHTSVTADTVSQLCHRGHVTEAVEALGVLVQTDCCFSKDLLYSVLKGCVVKKDLVLGRRVHALIVRKGNQSDTFLCNHILRMYASHSRLQEAMDVFTMVGKPDAFMWSSIISAHVKGGQDMQAVELYHRMRKSRVKPDGHVFVAALQACASASDLITGQQVHADVLAAGGHPDSFVCSCLVDMYAKCGSLEDAQSVFESLGQKDVVTWNAMIAVYSQQGMGQEALNLYSAMQKESVAIPNSVTFVCLLRACASLGNMALEMGKQLHAQIKERGYQANVFVASSLVSMYAKCGSLGEAKRVFDELSHKDVVTWNAMIAAYSQHCMWEEALHLHGAMQEGIVAPNCVTYVCLLQACAGVGNAALVRGKQLHTEVRERGHQADLSVANSLVTMYAKCGSLDEAQRVFEGLSQKDVVTWTALMAGYAQQGMGQEALNLYNAMEEERIAVPDPVTFVCLLQACAVVGTQALEVGKQLHSRIKERRHEADVYVASSLVNMYAKCGSLEDAERVFARLNEKNVVTWNAMIAGYSQQGLGQEALSLYGVMQEVGLAVPDSMTFVCVLQACAIVGPQALEKGRLLHGQIREVGHQDDVFVASSLVNMYAKCGSLDDAQRVFEGLSQKHVVTWNAMITGYSQQGMGQDALRLYSTMQEEGRAVPNSVTFVSLLQACASVGAPALEKGKLLHTQIREQGHQADMFVASSLVKMYTKCGSLEDAQEVFDRLGPKDVTTWNAMISGYSQQGMGQEALGVYDAMLAEGLAVPDSVTSVCLLQACANLGRRALETGKQLHTKIRAGAHLDDVFVANSLVNMYAKCGSIKGAQRVFDELGEKNLVTWNALIAGYSQQGMGQEALHLYRVMQEGKIAPDSTTFACLLQACACMGTPALEAGEQLHAQIKEQGFQSDVHVASSLVHMYAKCGKLENAARVFEGLTHKSVVTWNTMIAGYSQQGMGHEALRLYSAMEEEGMVPDSVTFVSLLQACANVAALHLGRQLHAQIKEQGHYADAFVASSLINMYGKSGSMVDAQQVFDESPKRTIFAWNALIAGYSHQGDSEIVFNLVLKMGDDDIQPDGITLLSVLSVCSHTGQVNKAQELFEAMSAHHGISPTAEHYTCMVDLLGRAGRLDEALALVRTMPVQPNASVWRTLLSASQKWGNVEVGYQAFEQAVSLDEKDHVAYVLMSNIYIAAQMWDQAQDMQVRRIRARAWKQPGQSWWMDMDGVVHSFLVGIQQSPKSRTGLKQGLRMKRDGSSLHVDSIPTNLGELSLNPRILENEVCV